MEYILAPFARLQGITKRKILTRFIEQAWLFVYYSVFWTLGMVRLAPMALPARPPLTDARTSTFTARRPTL